MHPARSMPLHSGEKIAALGRRNEEFLVARVLPHHATRVGTVRASDLSLGGLGVDYIDLYLPHCRGRIPLVKTIEGFAELELYGMVSYMGVSNFGVDDMVELSGTPGVDEVQTSQILYNLTRRHPAHALLPWPANMGYAQRCKLLLSGMAALRHRSRRLLKLLQH